MSTIHQYAQMIEISTTQKQIKRARVEGFLKRLFMSHFHFNPAKFINIQRLIKKNCCKRV